MEVTENGAEINFLVCVACWLVVGKNEVRILFQGYSHHFIFLPYGLR